MFLQKSKLKKQIEKLQQSDFLARQLKNDSHDSEESEDSRQGF